MNQSEVRFVFIVAGLIIGTTIGSGQTTMPEMLQKGTLTEQMNYIDTKTRIYDNYRAIREDMFQMIKNNTIDSLAKIKRKIKGYVELTGSLNNRIDSLNSSLNSTKELLDETSRTKNNISLFGIQLNKITYNTIMWLIVAGLAALLIMGYLAFKRNLTVTSSTKKELRDLKAEFEEYRKTSREAREKMAMSHFNELKKLRGG